MARSIYVGTLEVQCRRCSTHPLIDLSAVNGRPDTPIWKLEASLRPVLHGSGMQLPVEAGGEHRRGAPNQLFLMGRRWRKAVVP
jgi:hypothetical protein